MRPETVRRLLNRGIRIYLRGGGVDPIKVLIPRLKKMHQKWVQLDGDPRSGEESYGYGDDDSCYWQMMYISDRWCCAVRLKWIIDGVESGAIGKIKQDNNHE